MKLLPRRHSKRAFRLSGYRTGVAAARRDLRTYEATQGKEGFNPMPWLLSSGFLGRGPGKEFSVYALEGYTTAWKHGEKAVEDRLRSAGISMAPSIKTVRRGY